MEQKPPLPSSTLFGSRTLAQIFFSSAFDHGDGGVLCSQAPLFNSCIFNKQRHVAVAPDGRPQQTALLWFFQVKPWVGCRVNHSSTYAPRSAKLFQILLGPWGGCVAALRIIPGSGVEMRRER